MNEKAQWSLAEIREAYRDILQAYNALSSPFSESKSNSEGEPETLEGTRDEESFKMIRLKLRQVSRALKEGADRSGNVQVWRRGDPLDALNQGLRDRIEKALRWGI